MQPRDVEAALRNLLSNAVKFADADAPRVTVAAEPVEGSLRVVVADNGIGIDPADRPRLFVPFQRLHSAAEYAGTGLGLPISRRLATLLGGRLEVESQAGRGSRFRLLLPPSPDGKPLAARGEAPLHTTVATEEQGAPAASR